jgi:hypothetical protein
MPTKFRVLLIVTAALLMAPASAAAQPQEGSFTIGGGVYIKPTDHMSTYEIWNSGSDRAENGDDIVYVREIDSESARKEDGRQLLAVVLVGQVDTAVQPIAFRVTGPHDESENRTKVRAKPRAGEKHAFDLRVETESKTTVSLTIGPGGHVMLAGHDLGAIQ